MLKKILSIAVVASAVTACSGSDGSSTSNNSTSPVESSTLGANPNFNFVNTNYVGAFEVDGSNWASFALDGSLPADNQFDRTTNDEATVFEPNVVHIPNIQGVTPADSCPSTLGGLSVATGVDVVLDTTTFKKCIISGDVTSDITLTNDIVWSLSGRVNVGNGNGRNIAGTQFVEVKLTVEAGTVFMSESGSSLVVTRNSKIIANGTEAKPIIMAGDATETFGGSGEWGGLVLQGNAYNNRCSDPSTETICNIAGEGSSGFFGGFDNSDSSGLLRYVIVTEAGSVLSDGDELNGIGFMGVGYNTTVEYIQVHGNADDGVEFFGGAVDAKWLVLTANKDDSIDWDEGYVGNIQFGIILQTQNQVDATSPTETQKNYAFELDTAGDANESSFQESNPTVANVTAIASLTGDEYSRRNAAIQLKKGSEGQFVNLLIVGDYTDCVVIEDGTVLSRETDIDNAFVNVYCSTQSAVNFKANDDSRMSSNVLNSTVYEDINNELASSISLQAAPTIASEEVR